MRRVRTNKRVLHVDSDEEGKEVNKETHLQTPLILAQLLPRQRALALEVEDKGNKDAVDPIATFGDGIEGCSELDLKVEVLGIDVVCVGELGVVICFPAPSLPKIPSPLQPTRSWSNRPSTASSA